MKTKPPQQPQPTHTPTPPWTFQDIEGIRDARGIPVDIRANAAFIVRAVNVHQELLSILKEAVRDEIVNPTWFDRARSIIHKAEGK